MIRMLIILCALIATPLETQGSPMIPAPSFPPERSPEEREGPPAPVAVIERNRRYEFLMALLLSPPLRPKIRCSLDIGTMPKMEPVKKATYNRRMTKRSSAKW